MDQEIMELINAAYAMGKCHPNDKQRQEVLRTKIQVAARSLSHYIGYKLGNQLWDNIASAELGKDI